MKLEIYLDRSAYEFLAKGYSLYPWSFFVCPPDTVPREGGKLLATVEVKLPSALDSVAPAVKALRAQKNAIYEEAGVEASKIEERLQNLLAISHTPLAKEAVS